MNPILEKTLACLVFIVVGILLKIKFDKREHVDGIKHLILTIALPATVFVALLGAKANIEMLFLPILALGLNFVLFFTTPFFLRILGMDSNSSEGRTMRLLLPSLAPGLSCFPYILEYLGEDALANAAMADVGNKIFVLIFLFVVGMNWYYRSNKDETINSRGKIKSLFFSLITEPINIVIIVAVTLLMMGINFQSLPEFISSTLSRMSLLMTPLVLIFIGLAVKLEKRNLETTLSLLFCRSGVSLLLSVSMISLLSLSSANAILLAVIFPLSACSFWPFAHMAIFNSREEENNIATSKRTFNMEVAVLVLACSLPFSTIIILTVLSSGEFFTGIPVLLVSGIVLITAGLIPSLVRKFFILISKAKDEEEKSFAEAS